MAVRKAIYEQYLSIAIKPKIQLFYALTKWLNTTSLTGRGAKKRIDLTVPHQYGITGNGIS